jgi:hypothetical protein
MDEGLWKSIDEREETRMDITFTPDQLYALARSRERESVWSRRLLLSLLIGLAGAFAYNIYSVSQLWARLSQSWMLAGTCLLLWRFRHGPRAMDANESCVSFLRREFEGKRSGLLEIRRYMFLLAPPVVVSWWGGGGRAIRLSRLGSLGVDPSSPLYEFARGPWPFVMTALLLVVVWFAFGLAAEKAARELAELDRRTRDERLERRLERVTR